jgi:hypothetical protein
MKSRELKERLCRKSPDSRDATNLQCSFDSTSWSHLSGSSCKASNVNISSRETITRVNGQSNFQGLSYKMLEIRDQLVNYMPEGIEVFFPNLEGILIYNSKLKKIEKKDLQKFPKLPNSWKFFT